MNELSELLVSSNNDQISAQPIKLSEQLLDNVAVQNELDHRKLALEQLQSNIRILKQMMTTPEDIETIQGKSNYSFIVKHFHFDNHYNLELEEKFTELNNHWTIMKQTNDLRAENLLLTQTCANTFWSQHSELSTFLNNISKQLSQIRPRSTSREHIEREKEKHDQLINEFSNHQPQFKEILEQHGSLLLTLMSSNPEETEDIRNNLNEIEQEWHRIENDLHTCQSQLEKAMIESAEFNSKLERVSTWFDDTTFPVSTDDNNEFERIRTFKEHLDCKYLDIVSLKQDYIDIEQHMQTDDKKERAKTNVVEAQLNSIDTKWTQLNDKIQEQ